MKTYLRHAIHNVLDVKELIALEYLDFEGKYKEYVEKHDFWEICYVEKGYIDLCVGSAHYTLKENQIMIVAPNKSHTYHSACGNESRVLVVCFESFSCVLKTMSERALLLDSRQKGCIDDIKSEFCRTFEMNELDQLEVLKAPVFGGQQALILQLEYLLISIVRRLSDDNSDIEFLNDDSFNIELADAVERYLRENVSKKLTLDDICHRFNYSRSFICKTFKERTGVSLMAYFNSMKLEEAKSLIRSTHSTVTEIAHSLGYSELQYFNSLFKKHVGVSPLTYRSQAHHNIQKSM